MNEQEPDEDYRGYKLRVYPQTHQVFRWQGCAFPNEVTPATPESIHCEGQTPEEVHNKLHAAVDDRWNMGS